MRDTTSSTMSPWTFASALFAGLLWGIACAMVVAAAAMAANEVMADGPLDPRTLLRFSLEAVSWAGLVASIAAVFPIGPIAGTVGWLLYRRGIASPWAYAAVGALSVAAAFVIVIAAATQTMRYSQPNSYVVVEEGVLFLLIAGCAAVGAFSGFMAGRVIRRAALSASI